MATNVLWAVSLLPYLDKKQGVNMDNETCDDGIHKV